MLSGFADLSGRTKLRITGSDRVRFLNGQTTNDVRKASAHRTQESCVLNAKGHVDGHIFLFCNDDAVWIDASRAVRESLLARLERYVIADDVTITDVTDEFGLFHLFGNDVPRLEEIKFCLESSRLTNQARDIWAPAARAYEVARSLSNQCETFSADDWETLRIENGVPEWGHELTSDTIPTEMNLQTRAIDYNKGCYIGQEVISRIKTSGQTRQRLCGLVSLRNVQLQSRMTLYSDAKLAGHITSAAFSRRFDAAIALGVVKRGFYEPGTALIARGNGSEAPVQVTSVPFQAAGVR